MEEANRDKRVLVLFMVELTRTRPRLLCSYATCGLKVLKSSERGPRLGGGGAQLVPLLFQLCISRADGPIKQAA